uniref:C-type lectin domain-containing protein n=1 Tax=Myripristis murdjan TaxID=586833 RepID=A0A667WKY6_9TELE
SLQSTFCSFLVHPQMVSLSIGSDLTPYLSKSIPPSGLCIPSYSASYAYRFVDKAMDWDEALSYCTRRYTQLAHVENMENSMALSKAHTYNYRNKAWIGLYDRTDSWYWVRSGKAVWFKWKDGEPDNKNASEFCVTMNGTDGTWSDANCLEKKHFVYCILVAGCLHFISSCN